MADNFLVAMTTIHKPGAGTQYVSTTGNDANSGTSASRKRTIGAAIAALGSGGGIVYVADGNYGSVNISGSYSNTAWLHVVAENVWGAQAFPISLSGSHVGVYGFQVDGGGIDAHGIIVSNGSRFAVWRCHVSNLGGAGIAGAGNLSPINNISWCYNLIHDTSATNTYSQSAMTTYEWSNSVGTTSHDWVTGYDNVIVGNICHSTKIPPGLPDGNGVIIDDHQRQQTGGTPYVGNWLVMGNLMVSNVAVGVHVFQSHNVDVVFNTCAYNGTQIDGNAGASTCNNVNYIGNLLAGTPWWNGYNLTNWTHTANVYLDGVDGGGGHDNTPMYGERNRTADSSNYFKTNSPTRTPNPTTADQYRPDGGSGIVEKYTITQTQYNNWSIFPDVLGGYRSGLTWAVGSTEATPNTGGVGAPVASFTNSPTSISTGQTVAFTDTSTNTPTSWSWNFGDGTTSTTQSPTKVYTTAGTYTVTLVATNSSGSGTTTKTITVTSSSTGGYYVGPTSGPGSVASQASGGVYGSASIVDFNYRMTGINGTTVVARAHAVIPGGAAPAGGRHVVAACHGAAGFEYGGGIDSGLVGDLNAWINAGYVVVFVDNEGLNDAQTGNAIPNPYINRHSAGRGVVDACRAVASITNISGHCAAYGYSQGGATALSAGEMHKTGYGNLLNMIVVAIDPVQPENFVSTYYNGWATSYCTAICMGSYYENRSLPLTSIFDANSSNQISSGAWDTQDVNTVPGVFISNPVNTPAWQQALRANSFGYTAGTKTIVYSALSGIGPTDNQNYATRARALGTSVTVNEQSTDHSGIVSAAYNAGALSWVTSNIGATDSPNGGGGGGGNLGNVPTANFTASTTAPTTGQAVTFTDTSTGTPTSWAWDFGDGSTSTSQNPSHSWTTTGTKTITLVSTNAYGPSAAKQMVITVSSASQPPSAGQVDFPTFFQTMYPPGAGRQYVALTGNDANSGTSTSPKRTISAAVNALGSGGIVWVGDGDYGPQTFSQKNFSANSWCLIMAQNLGGAKCSSSANDTIVQFNQCSYMGFYGFEITGVDDAGHNYQAGIGNSYNPGQWSHHLAFWKNHVHHVGSGGVGWAGNNQLGDYFDICYNVVHNTSRWLQQAASGISIYTASNYDQAAGYHNRIIGNVSYYNYNEASTANSDGNGIILDDFNHTQTGGAAYTAKSLVMGNLCVNNGGRGVHSPWSNNVDSVFNTVAHNCWQIGGGSGAGDLSIWGGRANWNITKPNIGVGYDPYFSGAGGGTSDANVLLAKTGGGTSPRVRTVDGFNYFKNNNPSLTPLTLTDWDGWRPDGGSGLIETVSLTQTDYDTWKIWPDLFGNYRPTSKTWNIGFTEDKAGSTQQGNPPVATFTASNVNPNQGQTITFTDTSTNTPTSWSWNFGDGTTSTVQNPSKSWSSTGTKTVTLIATNQYGSSAPQTMTIAVGSNPTSVGTITHPALGTHGHLVSSTAYGTTPAGHTRYKISFQTTSITGSIVTETGLAFVPSGSAPAGGRPVIMVGHGETGTNDDSAPSNDQLLKARASDQAGYLVSQTATGITSGGHTIKSILYKMRGVDGTLVQARAIAYIPSGAAPATGYRVIAGGHGITGGITDSDAPGNNGLSSPDWIVGNVDALLGAGYCVVLPDYEGHGVSGSYPFAVASSEARALCDAARAMAGATTCKSEVVFWGMSLGGHAVSVAGELVGDYAPEFKSCVVAIEPMVMAEYGQAYYGFGDATVPSIIWGMKLEDPTLDYNLILNSSYVASMASLDTKSNATIATQIPAAAFKANPWTTSPWSSACIKQSMGNRVSVPVIAFSATSGLPVAWFDAWVARAQAIGTNITAKKYSGGHDNAFVASVQTEATTFVAAQYATPDPGRLGRSIGDVDAWLNAGYVVVQPDYEGLTPGGDSSLKHPFMVGVSEARSLLDAAMAMAGITTIKASAAAVGFSQGGHAALFAGELADTYAVNFSEPAFPTTTPINITTLGVSAGGGDQQSAIQTAINNAAAGSVLLFPAGTYNHSGVIQVNKAITLYSTAGARLVGTDPLNMAIQINANNVRLEGLSIEGVGSSRQSSDETRAGISILGVSGAVVKSCTVKQSSAAGIFISNASNYYIVGNTVQNTLADSIHQTGTANHGYVLNNTVTGSGDDCIACVSYSGQDVNNITIIGNSTTGGTARGISLVGARDCLVQGNTIASSAAAGIYIASESSYNSEAVSRIMVRDNVLNGVNTNSAIYHGGIFLWGGNPGKPVDAVTVYNNQINNTVVGAAHLVIQGSNVTNTNFLNNATTGTKPHSYIEAVSAKRLIKHGQDIQTPSAIASNFSYAETLPWDGMTMTLPGVSTEIFSATALTQSTINAALDPLNGLNFTRLTNRFAICYAKAPSGADSVAASAGWTTTASNFGKLAAACASHGLKGIVFDNEAYFGSVWNGGKDWTNAYNRGKEVMAAAISAFPTIEVIVFFGSWISDTNSAAAYNSVGIPANDLAAYNWNMGAFFAGMVGATIGTSAKIWDGSEVSNAARTEAQFAEVYQYNKFDVVNSSGSGFIPAGDKTAYPNTVRIAQNIYNTPFLGQPMDSTIWQTTITNALKHCDDYVWLYTEPGTQNWWASGGVPTAWLTSTANARATAPASGGQWTMTDDTHNGTAVANYGTSPGIPPATTGQAVFTQFCSVAFDPIITSDYVTKIYNAKTNPEMMASIIYGMSVETPSLSLATVLNGAAVTSLPSLNSWYFNDTARAINYAVGSFLANPTTASNGWATAIQNNTPGRKKSRPARIYSPANGIGGGDVWLASAQAAGTTASRVTGSGGHQVILYPDAITWVSQTLSGQSGTGAPVASFTVTPASPQVGQTVTFTDTSTNSPTSWVWDFGTTGVTGGQTATSQNPTRSFTTTGTHTISLTATNANGSGVSQQTITVTVVGPPTASFNVSPSPAQVGQSVLFTDTSSGSPTSRSWNFGDGSTSTAIGPTHTYASPGSYVVALTVTNSQGSNTTTRSLTVDAVGGSTLTLQAEEATLVNSNYPTDQYAMHVSSTNAGYSGTGYVGNWGQVGETVQFAASGLAAGNYSLVLRYQQCGSDAAPPRQIKVNGNVLTTQMFPRTGTDWAIGTWTDTSPLTATLTSGSNTIEVVHNGTGNSDFIDLDRIVLTSQAPAGYAPVASFIKSPTGSINVGDTINFTDTSSNTPTSWNWNFGDSGTSTNRNPSHTFQSPGTFTVTLQAINAYGNTTATGTVVVLAPPPPPPVAAFTASATLVVVGQAVTFLDQSLNSPSTWAWTFGDTGTSTLQNPSHTYGSPGTYSVSVTVTNAQGSSSVSHQIVVMTAPVPDGGGVDPINRHTFTVVAKRDLSLSETNDLRRVISVFKPVSALMNVTAQETSFDDVPISRVKADSEWWEVVSSVVSKVGSEWAYAMPGTPEVPSEQPRPPFSLYQGEQWSHAGDIAAVVAYAEYQGRVIPNHCDRVLFTDGSHFDYTAELGVRWPQDVITEKLAADGALISHPYSHEVHSGKSRRIERAKLVDDRQASSRSAVAPLYYNGVNLLDLADRVDSLYSPYRRQAGVPQRFWATPEKEKSDPIMESVEIRLRTPQQVNQAKFEVAHFPQRVWLEVWNAPSSRWDIVWSTTIGDSIPSTIATRVDQHGRLHPQHSMVGHWVPFDLRIDMVETSRLRVRVQRLATGTAPRNSKGQEIGYSLGVKGFDAGYVVASRNDIPNTPTPDTPIGTSTDPIGSRVIYTVRERLARHAVDNDDTTAWLSEPQPMASAVVNFYLDTRTATGDGQLVDRWFIDPIKPGPLLNLYYSNGEFTDVMVADDDPLGQDRVISQGTFAVLPSNGLSLSNVDPCYFLVDNALLQFNPSRNWWFAGEIATRFSSHLANSPIFSFDEYILQFSDNSLVFASPSGNDVVLPLTWEANQVIRYMVSYDSFTNEITISANIGHQDFVTTTQPLDHIIVETILSVRLAADPSLTLAPDYILRGFVLNQGTMPDQATVLNALDQYIIKPVDRRQDQGLTNGALLRMHPTLVTDGCPFGMVGGSGNGFEQLSWTPIPRDYRLQKGWMFIPPTKAKFWNFEFSQLVAEPIEVSTPIERKVRLFPAQAMQATNQLREDPSLDIPAYESQANRWMLYADAPASSAPKGPSDFLPTTLLHAQDPAGPKRLRQKGWAYGFSPTSVGSAMPRFMQEGPHVYDTISYVQAEKLAYFVGIKRISAAMTTHNGTDNPDVIFNRFYDGSQVSRSTWNLRPGDVSTGYNIGEPAVLESAIYPTKNRVRAIQFATQQTDAIQIIPDDKFRDPGLAYSTWEDPHEWHRVGDATLIYTAAEQQVLIRRAVSTVTDSDPYNMGLEQPPVHPVFATTEQGIFSSDPQDIGGIASPVVQTAANGMLHAAARITAVTDITNPLYVQIVDADGVILIEEPITAKRGDTVEWTASYYLGDYTGTVTTYVANYGNRTIVDNTVHPVFAGLPALVDSNGGPGGEQTPGYLFRVRLVQKGRSQDIWLVDRLSLFDDSIVWEFSVDGGQTYIPVYGVRNNPNGLVSFARPGTLLRFRVTGLRANLHISAIQIRPHYIHRPTHRLYNPWRGPNASTFDHFPPIQEDPEFKRWSNPVPSWWWIVGQNVVAEDQPVSGYPYSNEFNRMFVRTTITDLTTQDDDTSRSVTYARNTEDQVPLLDQASH